MPDPVEPVGPPLGGPSQVPHSTLPGRQISVRPIRDEVAVEITMREFDEMLARVRLCKSPRRPLDSWAWGLIGIAGGDGVGLLTSWHSVGIAELVALWIVFGVSAISGTAMLHLSSKAREGVRDWAEVVERDILLIRGRTEAPPITPLPSDVSPATVASVPSNLVPPRQ